MPGLVPPVADEREALLAFLAQQRSALRYAAHGVSDEQATARPTVSELCLAGLIKHTALVEQAWVSYLTDGDTAAFVPGDDWANGFRLMEGETLQDAIAFSEQQARETEKVVGDIADLGRASATDDRPRAVDPGRDRLDAALGVAAPDRGDGAPCRSRRRHPRVHRRRDLLDADGSGRGLAGAGLGLARPP